jgi:hypothetical protein
MAYYTQGVDSCDLVVMTSMEPGPRVRLSMAPQQAAIIEDVTGGDVRLTCGINASEMIVERHLPVHDNIAVR